MTCNKVILFYEKHNDPQATKTFVELMPLFKNMNINSICLEEPNDINLQEKTQNYEVNIKFVSECIGTTSLESLCSQRMLVSTPIYHKGKILSNYKTLPLNEQSKLLLYVNTIYKSYLEATQENLKLATNIVKYNFNYCAMDLPERYRTKFESENKKITPQERYDIRSLYMKDKILEACEAKGDVALIVGAAHFKLAQWLQNEGIKNIYEYYMFNSPLDTIEGENTEGCLRLKEHDHIEYCRDYQYKGMALDLNENPNLNTTELVGYHLLLSNIVANEL